MLRSFSVKNFLSFREEVHISLELNMHAPADGRSALADQGDRVSKVLAVIGPNGSGKTTLLKSLSFVSWFIKQSFQGRPDAPLPLDPHFVSPHEPCGFQVEFDMDGDIWRYDLSATPERVLTEALYRKQNRFSYVFIRTWDEGAKTYVVKQQQFGMSPREAGKVRPNASLIATAAQFGVNLASRMMDMQVFSNVTVLGRSHMMDHEQILLASDLYAHHDEYQSQMSHLLSQWDLGLSSVRLVKQELTDTAGEKREIHVPYGVHTIHGKEHQLFLMQESSGTQGAFTLLSRVLPVLSTGGLALIDELEADLHPHMLVPILDLFFSKKTNPYNAQIVFTTHAVDVIHQLHKGQIVLVEKNADCESDAWRMDEIKGIRADENLYAKYMAGAYGAVPQL